jgi:hypothetical protein
MPLAPLSELDDWRLEHDEQNIYGWPVTDSSGASHGAVFELIVDTDQERVVEVVTDTGERFDPHDFDIADGYIALREGVAGSGVSGTSPVMSTSEPAGESAGGPAPDWTTDVLINRARPVDPQPPLGARLSPQVPDEPAAAEPVVGASMSSAAPVGEDGPPQIDDIPGPVETGLTSMSEWTTISSRPEQRSPRIRRVSPGEHLAGDGKPIPPQPTSDRPADHQLGEPGPEPPERQLEGGREPIDHQLKDPHLPPDHQLKP